MTRSRRLAIPLCAFIVCGCAPAQELADSATSLLSQARRAHDAQRPEEALALATKAIEANAEDPSGYSLRASLHEASGRLEEALEDYDRLVQLLPQNADVYNQRGSAHFKAGTLTRPLLISTASSNWSRAKNPTTGSGASPITTPGATVTVKGNSSPIKPSIRATSKTPFGTTFATLACPVLKTPARNCFPSGMIRASR